MLLLFSHYLVAAMHGAFQPPSVFSLQGTVLHGNRTNLWFGTLHNPPRPSLKRPLARPSLSRNNMSSDTFETPISEQRQRWFATEMGKNRSLYTREKNLKLFTGTWNVNGKSPQPEADFAKWLFPHGRNNEPFDIYMLGMQEIQSLTGVDALRSDFKRGGEWLQKLANVLGSDYELVAHRQLVGILVAVYLRKNHTPFLSNVQLSYAGTGFLSAVGNKGGVAARFQLYDRTISCVACHLAAHVEFVERRNQDFKDVVRKAVFLPDQQTNPSLSSLEAPNARTRDSREGALSSAGALMRAESVASQAPASSNGPGAWLGGSMAAVAAAFSDISAGANTAVLNDPNSLKIFEHDVIFWLGDLNYRIDASLADVMKWIGQEEWGRLYEADQLQQQMKTFDAFRGFEEGRIRFPPTYKINKNGIGYKTGENGEQVRVPAYTDRILWRLGENVRGREGIGKSQIKLLEYNSPLVLSSDHRPVYASFQMAFGIEDVSKKADVEERVNRELDRREASLRPSIQFSSVVDFGDVFFEQHCCRKVPIRNTGTTTAFITISQPLDPPSWFLFDPSPWQKVKVPPGKAIQLEFGAFVHGKNGSANEVSRDGCVMSTTVRVSAEPGGLRERINVRGRYVATTLGLSLETLSMLERPVLALRDPDNNAKSLFSSEYREYFERELEPGIVPRPIPKELWLLVQALLCPRDDGRESILETEPKLFLREGEEVDRQRVLSFVDRGEHVPQDVDGYAIGSCILHVLRNLEDTVVPQKLHRRVVEAGYSEDSELVHNVLDTLPPLNSNVLWYLVGFLNESPVVRGSIDGRRELAEVFGEALLAKGETRAAREKRNRTMFMMEALRIYDESRKPRHRAIFDLQLPESHPRKLSINNRNE